MPEIRLVKPAATPRPPTNPHVLFALDQFTRTLGGGERALLRMAAELPRFGFNVSILALSIDPQSPAVQPPALTIPIASPIYELPLNRAFSPSSLPAALTLRRFLRAQNITLVQTFFESSDLWTGPVAKLLAGTRLIWSRRDMGILRQKKHFLAYRLMARLPDHVFAVSDQVRAYTINVDRIPAARVETLHNGVDLAQFSTTPPTLNPAAPSIVTVGNIRRVKGHDIFLRAAARIAEKIPGAHFIIAGQVLEPDFYNHLLAIIAELNLTGRVTFAGNVTAADLPAFLARATLFVLPSRSEGFSNAIVEAMAAGLPVVATNVGGNAEAVSDPQTGRIVPPEDVDALATAILDVLADPAGLAAMGSAGRQRAINLFSTDAMMTKLVAVYRRLLKLPTP